MQLSCIKYFKKIVLFRERALEPCALSEEAYLSSGTGSPCAGLSREERRRRRRATLKYRTAHATRERIRVEAFNAAFASLRRLLPTLPPDKKLSKIEILRLAICYIAYLNHVLDAWFTVVIIYWIMKSINWVFNYSNYALFCSFLLKYLHFCTYI